MKPSFSCIVLGVIAFDFFVLIVTYETCEMDFQRHHSTQTPQNSSTLWIEFQDFETSVFNVGCNIEKRDYVSNEEFERDYKGKKPFILKTDNGVFTKMCEKQNLLDNFGNEKIQLSTSDTRSLSIKKVTLREYIEDMMFPVTPDQNGEDSLYHFGSHDFQVFNELFQHYKRPPFKDAVEGGSLSWGLGGNLETGHIMINHLHSLISPHHTDFPGRPRNRTPIPHSWRCFQRGIFWQEDMVSV